MGAWDTSSSFLRQVLLVQSVCDLREDLSTFADHIRDSGRRLRIAKLHDGHKIARVKIFAGAEGPIDPFYPLGLPYDEELVAPLLVGAGAAAPRPPDAEPPVAWADKRAEFFRVVSSHNICTPCCTHLN